MAIDPIPINIDFVVTKPILFNTEMVRAILDGRKTQTRRVIKQNDGTPLTASNTFSAWAFARDSNAVRKFNCFPGDILWVRETWGKLTECNVYPPYEPYQERFIYRADLGDPDHFQARWRPSIHMPKEAARIFLRVTGMRVERMNDMGEEDAIAEGFADSPAGTDSPLERFSKLWDKTIKREDLREYGWHANPWVWEIEFERCEKPEGWCR